MDQKIVGFNQFGAVIRKVKAWVESTFLTLSKDSADQSIADVRSVSDIINLAKGASGAAPLTKITYAELKALRDGAKLVPGMQYRITDYTCTTITQDTQSAGHVFDVIVTADDERTLNAKAGAMKHEGDTYFTKSDLAKWQIWYDLNNDPTRYGWSDEANGKGVIYRMVDEYGNDCPYDFKNIQFKRYKITSNRSSLDDKYTGIDGFNIVGSIIPDKNDFKWFYTFSFVDSDSTIKDTSAINPGEAYKNYAGHNIIKCFINPTNSIKLNNIVISDDVQDNTKLSCQNYFEVGCANNTFRSGCNNNKFGDNCSGNGLGSDYTNNKFGDNCNNNTFGDSCSGNGLGSGCNNNTFSDNCLSNDLDDICNNNTFGFSCSGNGLGSGCTNNKFGDNCNNNKFGDICSGNKLIGNNTDNKLNSNNTGNIFRDSCSGNGLGSGCTNNKFDNYCSGNGLGDSCLDNSFRPGCTNNTFRSGCTNNTFGTGCANNAFGDRCQKITFGDSCTNNTFRSGCANNTFGTGCANNAFGDRCQKITFGEVGTPIDYIRYVDIASGVSYVNIIPTSATSVMNNLQNISIHKGVKGTEDTPLVINVDVLGQGYEIIYTKAADGTLVKQIAQA